MKLNLTTVSCNATMAGNNTTSCEQPNNTVHYQLSVWHYILVVNLVFIFVIGIAGNSVVCYVFGYKRRKDRTLPELLFLYLAVVDLMASLINPILHFYFTMTFHRKWHFGRWACKIVVPLAPVTTTVSAGIILMIGLDRYRVIVTPFKRHYSRKQIHLGVLFTVVLSMASFMHYIIAVEPLEKYTCQALVGDFAFSIPNIAMLIIRDVTFLVIFGWVNFKIFYVLKQRRSNKELQAMKSGGNAKSSNEFRVLITVGVLFLVLIYPADLWQLIFTASWLDGDGIGYANILPANTFLKILHMSNSCVNIFIYSRLHSSFRKVMKEQIFGKSRGRSYTTTLTTSCSPKHSATPV